MLALVATFAFSAQAQFRTPAASPSAKVMQMVGLTDITVEYSRPSMRGREVFGGIVPFGEIWRTGANAATKITFSTDVMIGEAQVKAGSYAILSKPGESAWEIMFFPYESGNWGSYVEKTPAHTFKAEAMESPRTKESFTIEFDGFEGGVTSMSFSWDKTMVALTIDTQVDATVTAAMEKMLAGPSASEYYAMGAYLYDSGRTGKDLEKALTYVQKSTQSDNPRFWEVRKEALILAKLGKTKAAIKAATLSKELAEKAGNKDYVRMNEASIAEWSK